MNENNGFYKNEEERKPLGLVRSPISFFYHNFKFVNKLTDVEKNREEPSCMMRFLRFKAEQYSREYDNDSGEFMRRIWLSLIHAKEAVVGGNEPLAKVFVDAEKYGISRDDLNNIAYLNVSNILGKLIQFKEIFYSYVDWDKAGHNITYLRLKRKLFDGHDDFLEMKEDLLCTRIRNTIAHNNYDLSSENGEVAVLLYPNGRADGKVIKAPLPLLKEYLEQVNRFVDGAFIKNYNAKKIAGLSNGYLKFKNAELLKENPEGERIYLNRTRIAKFFERKNEIFMALYYKPRRSANAVASDINFAFNEIMCQEPAKDYFGVNKILNERLQSLMGEESGYLAWKVANSPETLLCNDAIGYAKYMLTSNFYDKDADYDSDENMKGILGSDARANLEKIRNSLIHGWYSTNSDGLIRLYDLNDQGRAKLRAFKREDRRMRRAGTYTVADAVALKDAEYNIKAEDLDLIETCDREDLVAIAEAVYENYSQRNNNDEDDKFLS